MPDTQRALDNLERINDELDPRAVYIIKILIEAGLPCREYDSAPYLEKLADAVHMLWNHLCQLDTGNLEAWDIPVLELASILGRGMGARTFTDSQDYQQTSDAMDALSEDMNPVDVETELGNVIDMKPEGGDK